MTLIFMLVAAMLGWLLFQEPPPNPVTDDQTLQLLLKVALTSALGYINQKIIEALIQDRLEQGKPISPRTKRYVAFALSILTPTVIYLTYTLVFNYEPYNLASHVLYMLGAFGVMQAIHGQTRLPSGEDVKKAEAEAARRGIR